MLLEAPEGEVGVETEEISRWVDRVRSDLAAAWDRTNRLEHSRAFLHTLRRASLGNLDCQIASIGGHCIHLAATCSAELHVSMLDRSKYLGLEVFDTTLIHVQPTPYFETCYARAGLNPRPDVYRIGMWYWEFEQAPAEWRRIARSLDEVWAPSRFVAHALREILEVPVVELDSGRRGRGGHSFRSGSSRGSSESYALSFHFRCEQRDRTKESLRLDHRLSPSLPIR